MCAIIIDLFGFIPATKRFIRCVNYYSKKDYALFLNNLLHGLTFAYVEFGSIGHCRYKSICGPK